MAAKARFGALIHPIIGILKSKIGRAIGQILAGSALAQLVNLLTAPLITRLFSPDAFGAFSVILSSLTILAMLATLRYDYAIVLPAEQSRAATVFRLGLKLNWIWVGILCIALSIAFWPIAKALGIADYEFGLWSLPVLVLITGQSQALSYWHTRQGRFRLLSIAPVVQSLVTALLQITSGLIFGSTFLGLISGRVLGQAAGLLPLVAGIVKSGERKLLQQRSTARQLIDVAKEYRDFPLFTAPKGLLNVASINLPVIILSGTFDAAVAGYYAIAERLLKLPARMLGQSMRQVLYPKLTSLRQQNKSLSQYLFKSTLYLLLAGIPFAIIIALFAPSVFALLLGEPWRVAGEFAQLLAPIILTSVISSPTSSAVPIIGAQRFTLIYEIIASAVRLGAMLLGIHTAGAKTAVLYYAITTTISDSILIALLLRRARVLDKRESILG